MIRQTYGYCKGHARTLAEAFRELTQRREGRNIVLGARANRSAPSCAVDLASWTISREKDRIPSRSGNRRNSRKGGRYPTAGDAVGPPEFGILRVFQSAVSGAEKMVNTWDSLGADAVRNASPSTGLAERAPPGGSGAEGPPHPAEDTKNSAGPHRASDDIYEGIVMLKVHSEGDILQLVYFLGEMRRMPQFRLMRLIGNRHEVEILLRLREPVNLKDLLGQIQGVTQVGPSPEESTAGAAGDSPVFGVRFAGAAA